MGFYKILLSDCFPAFIARISSVETDVLWRPLEIRGRDQELLSFHKLLKFLFVQFQRQKSGKIWTSFDIHLYDKKLLDEFFDKEDCFIFSFNLFLTRIDPIKEGIDSLLCFRYFGDIHDIDRVHRDYKLPHAIRAFDTQLWWFLIQKRINFSG